MDDLVCGAGRWRESSLPNARRGAIGATTRRSYALNGFVLPILQTGALLPMRASSHDPKDDLERQKQALELFCARQGWTFEV